MISDDTHPVLAPLHETKAPVGRVVALSDRAVIRACHCMFGFSVELGFCNVYLHHGNWQERIWEHDGGPTTFYV